MCCTGYSNKPSEYINALNFYFWKDLEAEVNFMTKHMETIEERVFGEDGNMYPVGSERLLAIHLWERQLKKAGAVG